ncbi:hypothetical protein [Cohnella nanjingensis]|uniref:Uncharacterized protein n=1 Tax=Cohnella nanjingensis TaxID=1387779 RepID=A0A7X0RWP8_9BACL|nr:hypothetical protein [Cohnella nanjingensis]MBB6675043.1 hypothetical protein [Cohnella nanjingensis]
MILPLIRYMLVSYSRSYRYLPPLLAFVVAIGFVYSNVPNPIMESYAFSSTLLFIVSAWLTFGFMDAEPIAQQRVTVLHARSLTAYYVAKLLLLSGFGSALGLFATLYPALLRKFDRSPSLLELGAALLAHGVLVLLGIGCAAFFTEKSVPGRPFALAGLAIVVILSVAGKGLANALPDAVAPAAWLLPPAFRVMDALIRSETVGGWGIALSLAVAALYAILLMALFVRLMSRKQF